MSVIIYQKCLEAALKDPDIQSGIAEREQYALSLVEVKSTFVDYWPNYQGFQITRVRILFNYQNSRNQRYQEDISVDVDYRVQLSDGQEEYNVVGKIASSIYPH